MEENGMAKIALLICIKTHLWINFTAADGDWRSSCEFQSFIEVEQAGFVRIHRVVMCELQRWYEWRNGKTTKETEIELWFWYMKKFISMQRITPSSMTKWIRTVLNIIHMAFSIFHNSLGLGCTSICDLKHRSPLSSRLDNDWKIMKRYNPSGPNVESRTDTFVTWQNDSRFDETVPGSSPELPLASDYNSGWHRTTSPAISPGPVSITTFQSHH
jgi:hypothetical protein